MTANKNDPARGYGSIGFEPPTQEKAKTRVVQAAALSTARRIEEASRCEDSEELALELWRAQKELEAIIGLIDGEGAI